MNLRFLTTTSSNIPAGFRIIFSLFLLLPLFTLLTGCSKEEKPAETQTVEQPAIKGFRSAQWGMTADEVKKVEKLKVTKDDSTALVFSGEVYGYKAEVFYFFDESGSLFSGTVKFVIDEKNPDGAVSIYKAVKSELEKQLGKPSVDEVLLNDSSKTEDLKSPGAGLMTENKIYTTDWNDNPGTQIGMILSKLEKSPLSLGIVYQRK